MSDECVQCRDHGKYELHRQHRRPIAQEEEATDDLDRP